jgi:hypothetical protein
VCSARIAANEGARRYERHRPEKTLLFQIIEEYYPQFLTLMEQQGRVIGGSIDVDFWDDALYASYTPPDMTNERPNVYYEIGYAMGLDKRLILTSKSQTPVHFDLHGYNRIEWSGSENLKRQLKPIVSEIARSFGLAPG